MLNKLSTFLLLGFFVLVEPLQAIAQQATQPPSVQPPSWYWHGPWQGPWHGSQFWWICPIVMLFIFFVFIAIFFARRHHWGSPWHMMDRAWGSPTHSALQILNERFARGEIEKDEYEDKKAIILSSGRQ